MYKYESSIFYKINENKINTNIPNSTKEHKTNTYYSA